MNISILDDNKFYALGLTSLIRKTDVTSEIKIMNEEWSQELLMEDAIISKCYLSANAHHLKLLHTLIMLNTHKWNGKLILITDRKNISLAEYFIKRFDTLNISYINESIAIDKTASPLHNLKIIKRNLTSNPLNEHEFIVISLIICGLRGRDISEMFKLPERVVSRHKVNALSKLNVNRLSYLFSSRH
ncbi:TPA: hypothetical protein ACS614_001528 [Klebsiella aerogenes]